MPVVTEDQIQPYLLPLNTGCVEGTFVRREKRFFVACMMDNALVWAHTNNSGSMLGLLREGNPVILSPAASQTRKLPYTLELIGMHKKNEVPVWIGVNTLVPNRLLRASFEAGVLPWAAGYTTYKAEAKRGQSRLDALLTGPDVPPLWVECKNVTMSEDGGVAGFPDAVTERGQKHLREMMDIVASGERAAFFYCIQRPDVACFAPADYVDSAYATLFYQAKDAGVEAYPHLALVSALGIGLGPLLPLVDCPRSII